MPKKHFGGGGFDFLNTDVLKTQWKMQPITNEVNSRTQDKLLFVSEANKKVHKTKHMQIYVNTIPQRFHPHSTNGVPSAHEQHKQD